MKSFKLLVLACATVLLTCCGSLERKAILVNAGDDKSKVISAMGMPGDRQFQGKNEVWQYGQTGAGFGYHDFRMIWFYDGRVTGITSYKDYTPASSASAHFKAINWQDAPNYTLEIRNR